jgi:hypothetical protein
MDGQFGSTDVDELGFPPDFGPSQAAGGSLGSNVAAPQAGDLATQVPFNAPCSSQNGQTFCESIAMLANPTDDPLRIVFAATLVPDGLLGQDWSMSFGSKTLGGTSNVTVDFSVDGTTYGNAQVFGFTTGDIARTADFSAVSGDLVSTVYLRFTFDAVSGNEPLIDNVAIFAASTQPIPEPGTAMLLMTGLLGLGLSGRRRS